MIIKQCENINLNRQKCNFKFLNIGLSGIQEVDLTK